MNVIPSDFADGASSVAYHLAEYRLATQQHSPDRRLPEVPDACHILLDVGCGIGQSLAVLGENRDEVGLYGVDIDHDAVVYGQRRFPKMRLAVAGGEALPFPDGFADMVVSRVSLPYMHIPRALREFRRVLRPEGVLWVAYHPMSMFVADLSRALRTRDLRGTVYRLYAAANGVLLATGEQLRYPLNRRRIESYQPITFLEHAMRRAGFGEIKRDGNTLHARAVTKVVVR